MRLNYSFNIAIYYNTSVVSINPQIAGNSVEKRKVTLKVARSPVA